MERRPVLHTTVGIIGAGPAGLLLARLLHRAGVDCVVLEARDRAHCERRHRAGLLEQGSADILRACGAGGRLDREGLVHNGFELRFDGRAYRLDVSSMTGGRSVTAYPQAELVQDLIALQLADGAPLLFEAPVLAVERADSERPVLRYTHGGREQTLTCDFVAGCDGPDGASRKALPAGGWTSHGRDYPYSCLGILADIPPVSDELVLAGHPHGFALHCTHTLTVSRMYLQVPSGTTVEDWPDERIWDELETRLASDGQPLVRGPILARSVLPMRSQVIEPMRHGRLLLAGDAAHLVPPTSAKGLNMAFADVAAMARALIFWHTSGSAGLLDRYSDSCLRRIWQAQSYAHEMTTLLHIPPDADVYDRRMQLARMRRLIGPTAAAAEYAENYAGMPFV